MSSCMCKLQVIINIRKSNANSNAFFQSNKRKIDSHKDTIDSLKNMIKNIDKRIGSSPLPNECLRQEDDFGSAQKYFTNANNYYPCSPQEAKYASIDVLEQLNFNYESIPPSRVGPSGH